MPRHKYLDEFRPISSRHPMLSFLFPSSRQITTALGALNAVRIALSEDCDRDGDVGGEGRSEEETLCLVLGEGADPRAAVMASVSHPSWRVVSVDPSLDSEWENPNLPDGASFSGYAGDVAAFLSEGKSLVSSLCPVENIRRLVVVALESGRNYDALKSLRGRLGVADLRMLYNNAPATVVSLSSDEAADCPMKMEPAISFVDEDILSQCRRVRIWKFRCSGRAARASSAESVSSPRRASPDLAEATGRRARSRSAGRPAGEGPAAPVPFPPSKASRAGRSSKVAQLARQQELASRNRMRLRAAKAPEGPAEGPEGHSSAAGTDDTSDASSESEEGRGERGEGGRPPRSRGIGSKLKSLRRAAFEKKGPDGGLRSSQSSRNSENDTLRTDSKDSLPSILSIHRPECPTFFERSKSAGFLDRRNESPSASPLPVKDVLLRFAGAVPPSSLPASAKERRARKADRNEAAGREGDSDRDGGTESALDSAARTEPASGAESTPRAESASREESSAAAPLHPRERRQVEYPPGSVVEVKISSTYQPATIDSQPFRGVYNVILFADTPAWNEKRSSAEIYRRSPERMPEVLARDLRPFVPAPVGEVIYVFVNGAERKCCVHGYSLEEGRDADDLGRMKYVVKFAKKDGEWRSEKHRVPVQRAYRKLCEV